MSESNASPERNPQSIVRLTEFKQRPRFKELCSLWINSLESLMKEILRHGWKTMRKLHETVVGTMSKDRIGFHGSLQ